MKIQNTLISILIINTKTRKHYAKSINFILKD